MGYDSDVANFSWVLLHKKIAPYKIKRFTYLN
jgi:hypothetical protein